MYREFYQGQLEGLGYECKTVNRDPDAVLVGWDKSKYTLIEYRGVCYNDLLWCGKYDKYRSVLRQSDNVALICLLRNLETGSYVMVANTHLFYNPAYDHQKFGQTFWLLKNIGEVLAANSLSLKADDQNSVALFVAGDFNSGPNSTSSHLMHNIPITPQTFDGLDREVQRAYEEEPLKREFLTTL